MDDLRDIKYIANVTYNDEYNDSSDDYDADADADDFTSSHIRFESILENPLSADEKQHYSIVYIWQKNKIVDALYIPKEIESNSTTPKSFIAFGFGYSDPNVKFDLDIDCIKDYTIVEFFLSNYEFLLSSLDYHDSSLSVIRNKNLHKKEKIILPEMVLKKYTTLYHLLTCNDSNKLSNLLHESHIEKLMPGFKHNILDKCFLQFSDMISNISLMDLGGGNPDEVQYKADQSNRLVFGFLENMKRCFPENQMIGDTQRNLVISKLTS